MMSPDGQASEIVLQPVRCTQTQSQAETQQKHLEMLNNVVLDMMLSSKRKTLSYRTACTSCGM